MVVCSELLGAFKVAQWYFLGRCFHYSSIGSACLSVRTGRSKTRAGKRLRRP